MGFAVWLSPNSFFRKQYPDIECIMATTIDAARQVLGSQDIIIDYLHIDADHSFSESCLNDFLTYRRFLRPGSVVTLHDTNFPSAGVRYVIEYLNTRSDCEVINFGLGVGTALVRITGSDWIRGRQQFSQSTKKL